jgi:hypothetical protein
MYKTSPAVNNALNRKPDISSYQETGGERGSLPETPDLHLGYYRYFIGLRGDDHVLLRCPECEPEYLAEVLDHESLGITDHDIMLAVRECPGHHESDAIPVSDHMSRKLQIIYS